MKVPTDRFWEIAIATLAIAFDFAIVGAMPTVNACLRPSVMKEAEAMPTVVTELCRSAVNYAVWQFFLA
ncbi:hypothetical protein [Nostoc sp.]